MLRVTLPSGTAARRARGGAGPRTTEAPGRQRLRWHPRPARMSPRADFLAAEEPLGIRVDGTALTMTMRTPGDDVELAAGFLVGEAIVRGRGTSPRSRCAMGPPAGTDDHDEAEIGNIVDVALAPGVTVPPGARRELHDDLGLRGVRQDVASTTSACCRRPPLSGDDTPVLPRGRWPTLPDRLREAQRVFVRDRRAARGGAVHRRRRAARRPRGRRAGTTRSTRSSAGRCCRAAAAGRVRAAGQRPGVVRAGAEGGAGRDTAARRGVRAVLAGRRAGRRRPG